MSEKESPEFLPDLVNEELMRRLKRVVNSKLSRMNVRVYQCGYVGHWENLEITGSATLSNFEEHYSFDFQLRNKIAREFLESCDLEIPEKKKAPFATRFTQIEVI